MRKALTPAFCLLVACSGLTACGQMGPLYEVPPEQPAEATAEPAPATVEPVEGEDSVTDPQQAPAETQE